MLQYKFKIILLSLFLILPSLLLSMDNNNKQNQEKNFFYKLPDELIIRIIEELIYTAATQFESLKFLENIKLIDTKV